jgi:tetratricopeptide (TPR) repeat protein
VAAGGLGPPTPEVAFRQATQLHRAGRLADADAAYAEVLKAEPGHADALRLRGILARQRGDLEQSRRWLRAATRAAPEDVDALTELGLSEFAAGYLLLAEGVFRRAVRLDALSIKARANLGAVLQYRGHIREAIDCYVSVLNDEPLDAEIRCNLALTRLEAGQGEAALATLDAIVPAPGTAPLLDAARGAVLVGLERHPEALAPLRSAMASGLDDPLLPVNLAAAEAACGEPDAAMRLLREAVIRDPMHARATADLMNLLHATGETAGARQLGEDFLVRAPGERLILAALGPVLRDSGALDDAQNLLDYARLVSVSEVELPEFHAIAGRVLADPSLLTSPRSKSTRAGAQTGELDVDGDPLWRDFRDALNRRIVQLVADWRRAGLGRHPAMAWGRDHWTLRLWATVLEAGGHQEPHIHPLGWLSGVYYVELPPGMGEGDGLAGGLEFGVLPARMHHRVPPERHGVRPQPASLVIFPSYFHHRTRPFTGPGRRISLAFDVVPG